MAQKSVSTQDLVVWVNEYRWPMAEVVAKSGMTRQGVYKRLKAAGCLVKRREKGGAPGVHVRITCSFCGNELVRRKRQVLKAGLMRQFCNQTCYFAALENPSFQVSRQGSRLARAIVQQHFPLEPQHIVHHKDGNQKNNDRSNLLVFASQSDHLKHHRGRTVNPLWDGAETR